MSGIVLSQYKLFYTENFVELNLGIAILQEY